MKRFIVVLSMLSILLLVFVPVTLQAADLITTDKKGYEEGESIYVTAQGGGKDWVGIYLKTDVVESTPSILWYYVAADGNQSGTSKNIFNAEYNNERDSLESLPAGEYVIYLFENNGYNVLDMVEITIKAKSDGNFEKLAAPKKVEYKSGKIVITAAEGDLPYSYEIYWADENGILDNYTMLADVEWFEDITEYTIDKNLLIPKEADRIFVMAKKSRRLSDPVCCMLPDNIQKYDFGKLLYEMQVLSDIHINSDQTHIHNIHFAAALEDIKKLSPNSIGVFINGDVADHGQESEYKAFSQIIANSGENTPPVFCAIGNHDLLGNSYDEQLRLFTEYTNPATDKVYFDQWINGVHFIYLGSENTGLNAELSQKQLQWLKDKLSENRDENRPIYVFLHQGIIDTVAGTFEYQKWHGVNQGDELATILKDYREVILFTGHSHWQMQSPMSMKARDSRIPTVFNTASVAYLWDDNCMSTNIGIEGSQGYYIKAYEDGVLVLGRDFVSGKWISSAQYVVDYGGSKDNEKTDSGLMWFVVFVCIVVIMTVVATIVIIGKKRQGLDKIG